MEFNLKVGYQLLDKDLGNRLLQELETIEDPVKKEEKIQVIENIVLNLTSAFLHGVQIGNTKEIRNFLEKA